MIRMILSGCNGRMGRAVSELVQGSGRLTVVAGIDVNAVKSFQYPVYADPREFRSQADVLLDFSNPSSLSQLLPFCLEKKIPAVFATTGYSEAQLEDIQAASTVIPIFRTANLSLGISLITELACQAAKILGYDYNIEIIERHHNKKLDAPSGTALALAEAIRKVLPTPPEFRYGRHGTDCKRQNEEIGIHAVRGGTIVGEHEILFAGNEEIIEIRHQAASRGVFATGALKAAEFLAGKSPGLYSMKDIVQNL